MGRTRKNGNPLGLPPRVYWHHGAYRYQHKNGKFENLGTDLELVKEILLRRERGLPEKDAEESEVIPFRVLKTLLRNARKNSKSRNLECTLTIEDMQALAILSGGRCQLTKIRFEYGVSREVVNERARRRKLWAPSIDRKDSSLGYSRSNVRLVCFAVNAALQEFGDKVLIKIASALERHSFPTKTDKIRLKHDI